MAVRVSPTRNELRVTLTNGAVYVVPLSYTSRLAGATARQLRRRQLIGAGIGIHWPAIDEDLSVAGIVRDGTRLDVPNGSTRRRSAR